VKKVVLSLAGALDRKSRGQRGGLVPTKEGGFLKKNRCRVTRVNHRKRGMETLSHSGKFAVCELLER